MHLTWATCHSTSPSINVWHDTISYFDSAFLILEQPHTFPTFVRAPFISVKLGFSNYQVWFPHSYFDWQQTLPENRKDYLLKRGNCTIQCTPMFIFKHFLSKLLFIWRKCTNMQSICIPHYTASLREGIIKNLLLLTQFSR